MGKNSRWHASPFHENTTQYFIKCLLPLQFKDEFALSTLGKVIYPPKDTSPNSRVNIQKVRDTECTGVRNGMYKYQGRKPINYKFSTFPVLRPKPFFKAKTLFSDKQRAEILSCLSSPELPSFSVPFFSKMKGVCFTLKDKQPVKYKERL